jgi:hypothetical protein
MTLFQRIRNWLFPEPDNARTRNKKALARLAERIKEVDAQAERDIQRIKASLKPPGKSPLATKSEVDAVRRQIAASNPKLAEDGETYPWHC